MSITKLSSSLLTPKEKEVVNDFLKKAESKGVPQATMSTQLEKKPQPESVHDWQV